MSTKPVHPAPYSKEIIEQLAILIPSGVHVHDPCAGEGRRLGSLADRAGFTFSGTEIEPCFIKDQRVVEGNACNYATYPRSPFWVVTSVVYPNGIADHFEAKDDSDRNTYRQAVAAIEGSDRPLHPDNQGRYGYRNTKRGGTSEKRRTYWELAERMLVNWVPADALILNVSDFTARKGIVEPFVQDWIELLVENWFVLRHDINVETQRYRNGSDGSRDERVPYERVLVFDPPG